MVGVVVGHLGLFQERFFSVKIAVGEAGLLVLQEQHGEELATLDAVFTLGLQVEGAELEIARQLGNQVRSDLLVVLVAEGAVVAEHLDQGPLGVRDRFGELHVIGSLGEGEAGCGEKCYQG